MNGELLDFLRAALVRPGTVPVLCGPTASGKSGLALSLAQRLGGVVINADSMQVYRELSVLTARPGASALEAVPHRLYGGLTAAEGCSAARWRDLALAAILDAQSAGRVPLVVGGTGLYLRALMVGLAEIPDIPAEVRAAARARLDTLGCAGLHAELAARDPLTAARLRPSDSQRLIRAWEVLEATGRSLAEWQRATPERPPDGLAFAVIVLDPCRSALYQACDGRFQAMMAAGALDEVRTLEALELPFGAPVHKALGVPEVRRYLAGELALDEAIAQAQRATRNYAKRQVTWFRHQLVTNCPWPLRVVGGS